MSKVFRLVSKIIKNKSNFLVLEIGFGKGKDIKDLSKKFEKFEVNEITHSHDAIAIVVDEVKHLNLNLCL